jgi:hypothetical protein
VSDKKEKNKQETGTIQKEPTTSNKPPSYGTRFVQDREGAKANTVQQRNIKK